MTSVCFILRSDEPMPYKTVRKTLPKTKSPTKAPKSKAATKAPVERRASKAPTKAPIGRPGKAARRAPTKDSSETPHREIVKKGNKTVVIENHEGRQRTGWMDNKMDTTTEPLVVKCPYPNCILSNEKGKELVFRNTRYSSPEHAIQGERFDDEKFIKDINKIWDASEVHRLGEEKALRNKKWKKNKWSSKVREIIKERFEDGYVASILYKTGSRPIEYKTEYLGLEENEMGSIFEEVRAGIDPAHYKS